MAIMLGNFRHSGATSSSEPSVYAYPIGNMKISGLTTIGGLVVCNYVWDHATEMWNPMEQPATT